MEHSPGGERKSLPTGILRGFGRESDLGYWGNPSTGSLHNQEETHLNSPDRVDMYPGDGLYWRGSSPERLSTPEGNKQYRSESGSKELQQAQSTIVRVVSPRLLWSGSANSKQTRSSLSLRNLKTARCRAIIR